MAWFVWLKLEYLERTELLFVYKSVKSCICENISETTNKHNDTQIQTLLA